MKYRFVLHEEKCCACASCQIGCTDLMNSDPLGTIPGCRRILHWEIPGKDGKIIHTYGSVACMHCADAPCIHACPKGCIRRDSETGFVTFDSNACIGCRRCGKVCPYDIPQFLPEDGKMVKCDGCNDRIKQGLQPACVLACPFGALECIPAEAYRPDQDALPTLMEKLKERK